MLFFHLGKAQGLRKICYELVTFQNKMNHLGFPAGFYGEDSTVQSIFKLTLVTNWRPNLMTQLERSENRLE